MSSPLAAIKPLLLSVSQPVNVPCIRVAGCVHWPLAFMPPMPSAAMQPAMLMKLPDEPVTLDAVPVLFEDELLVVADKPHFMPVTPSGRYLQQSLLSVEDIARKLGFTESRSFIRYFKGHVGLTPGEFRAQLKDEPPTDRAG